MRGAGGRRPHEAPPLVLQDAGVELGANYDWPIISTQARPAPPSQRPPSHPVPPRHGSCTASEDAHFTLRATGSPRPEADCAVPCLTQRAEVFCCQIQVPRLCQRLAVGGGGTGEQAPRGARVRRDGPLPGGARGERRHGLRGALPRAHRPRLRRLHHLPVISSGTAHHLPQCLLAASVAAQLMGGLKLSA